jgi:hypothetical protein
MSQAWWCISDSLRLRSACSNGGGDARFLGHLGCRGDSANEFGIGAGPFKLLAGCRVQRFQDNEGGVVPYSIERPEHDSTRLPHRRIRVAECLLDRLFQDFQSARPFDRISGASSMRLKVILQVGNRIRSRLGILFLKTCPQQRKDDSRGGRCVCDDVGDAYLRLLCGEFLGETGHFEEIGQEEIAERVQARSESCCQFRIEIACVDCDGRSQTRELNCL